MKSAEEAFRDYLNSNGLKFTRERRLILAQVMRTHNHFEVEDILLKLRQHDARVSRTSIYRALPLLVNCGIVRKNPCDSMEARYEYTFGHSHHDHMVCVRCGRITEFKDERIEKMQEEVAGRNRFKALGHRLVISGLCERCR